MSTPSKRRKKNDFQPSPQPVRSLDFFFGKQRQEQGTLKESQFEASQSPNVSQPVTSNEAQADGPTDEEIARKLQDEWDQEERYNRADKASLSTDPLAESSFPSDCPPLCVVDTVSENGQVGRLSAAGAVESVKKATLSLQSVTTSDESITNDIPFDENPLTFQPTKYLPELQRLWALEGGGSASYALLTRCFVLVNSTQSRIKIVDTLVNFLRTIIEGDPGSLLSAVWLATNSISPPYISLELGLGGSAISKALKKTYGLDNGTLKTLYHKHGDVGDVAFEAKKKQRYTLRKPKPLSINGVYHSLVQIANSRGHGSQEVKQRIVERLLQDARGAEESRYIVRTLVQHLRIGAVKTTMLIALSRAFLLSRPSDTMFPIRAPSELMPLKKDALAETYGRGEELVKGCFARRPNYNDLVPCLLQMGISDELTVRCGLALHIPLRPMLGSITRDLGEMLTKLQGRAFSCEYKYDGQRAQVHCDGDGQVSIYSRHLELMTDKYPDLVALVPRIRGNGVRSFILEGEVVAVDPESGDLKAFQTLTNRARKEVEIGAITVGVCLFAFDLMYLNGEALLARPFRERRELLRSRFVEVPRQFTWVAHLDATSADSDAVLDFFKSATAIKCEGIMVKVLDPAPRPDLPVDAAAVTVGPGAAKARGSRRKALLSSYEPDKRLDSWLKVKKDYDASAETLDLIPVAGWHGTGRKAQWWSPILLAVRNEESGRLEAVTKCISGFSDQFYQAHKARYAEGSEQVISRPSYVDYAGQPDVWFEPQEVWELAFADITMSPTYVAALGLVSEERGLSMRFPRFVRVRADKSIEEASTSEFLASLWHQQEAGRVPAAAADEDD